MRWRDGRRSDNIEDRRGMPISRRVLVGGSGGLGVVVLVLLGMFFGFDPSELLRGGPSVQSPSVSLPQSSGPAGRSSVEDELKEFVSVVLADTEDVWRDLFARSGRTYRPPRLVLFTGAVDSQCGFAQAAMGPFYCPLDNKVYLDLSFFQELRSRFGAPGDFAEAYVVAHEVGHHVQTLLGVTQRFEEMRRRAGPAKANNLSVRLELQADCLAGVWAHSTEQRGILEKGDVESALGAAAAVGDDRLQRMSSGAIHPERWTHGSSEQRVSWFKTGFDSGDINHCDTFNNKN